MCLLQCQISFFFWHAKCGLWQSWTCCLGRMLNKLNGYGAYPFLWNGSMALLSRDRQSFEFTVNRLFMKIFRTGSPAVVSECQLNFNFLSIESQLEIKDSQISASVFCDKENIMLVVQTACNHAA